MREGDNSEDGEREERFENKTYGVFLLFGFFWDFIHPRRPFVLLPSFYCLFLHLSLSSLVLAALFIRHLSYYLLLVLTLFSIAITINGSAIIFFFDIITTSIHPSLSIHLYLSIFPLFPIIHSFPSFLHFCIFSFTFLLLFIFIHTFLFFPSFIFSLLFLLFMPFLFLCTLIY